MEANKVCPICGEPTNSYMGKYRKDGLCKKHAAAFKEGKIEQCEECGKWHPSGRKCSCGSHKRNFSELPKEGFDSCIICGAQTNGYAFCIDCYHNHSEEQLLDILNSETESYGVPNKVIKIDSSNKSKCIACGKPTDGLLFCGSCYHLYKDKTLLVKITNCSNVELLDESYEGKLYCKDGHLVKSKSERDIDNYLFDHGISHGYEIEYHYGPGEKEVIKPDFFLPDYLGPGKHVYLEHWGFNENNIKYTKSKKFKLNIYKESGITLVCVYEKSDISNIQSSLDRKLNKKFIVEGKVNFEE